MVLVPGGSGGDGTPFTSDLVLNLVRFVVLRVDSTNQTILYSLHGWCKCK